MTRHFLDIHQLDAANLRAILDDAHARKAARKGWPQGRPDADAPAKDRVLAMIFEKNSTRTRFSFDAAIRQLGGDSIIATASDMQLGRGEPVEDARGRVLIVQGACGDVHGDRQSGVDACDGGQARQPVLSAIRLLRGARLHRVRRVAGQRQRL